MSFKSAAVLAVAVISLAVGLSVSTGVIEPPDIQGSIARLTGAETTPYTGDGVVVMVNGLSSNGTCSADVIAGNSMRTFEAALSVCNNLVEGKTVTIRADVIVK